MCVDDGFWRKVDIGEPNDCWEWTGHRDRQGYGRAMKSFLAHRGSFELAHGPIPEGLCVLHRCDNPPCVNPAHLLLGTKRDNAQDAIAKGRWAPQMLPEHRHVHTLACAHPGAKLSADDVRLLRALYAAGGESYRSLAARFGVSKRAVEAVLSGETWKYVS